MIKIGITGGIGSGKSIVSSFLNTVGIPVYIADDKAKQLTVFSKTIREQLINRFGSHLYKNGELNKSLFSSLIFGNEENMKAANAIIHPEVLKDFLLWTAQQQKNIVAIETAILFESGYSVFLDHILTITAPIELRIQRVIQRSGLNREEVLNRIFNQSPDDWKMKISDRVIYNDGIKPIIPQLDFFLAQLPETS